MRLGREARFRLRALFGRTAMERELDAELRTHRERAEEKLRGAGLTLEEARRRARLELGGPEQVKETCREVRGVGWLEAMGRDLRLAGRSWRRNPVWTAIVLLTLALGIGANTAIFSAMDAVLLASLPVARPRQLYLLGSGAGGRVTNPRFAWPFFEDLRRAAGGAVSIAAFTRPGDLYSPQPDAPPRDIATELVSGNFFAVLGVRPARGRLLAASDNLAPDGAPVAVVSYAFWRDHLDHASDAVGRTLVLNGVALRIVGVAPRGFYGLDKGDAPSLWVPLRLQAALRYHQNADSDSNRGPDDTERPWSDQLGIRWLHAVARLPDAAAARRLAALATRIDQRDLAPYLARGSASEAASLRHEAILVAPGARGFADLARQLNAPLTVLLSLAGLLLLVACGSVALLLLARGLARRHETAVRLAIGAGRGALARQSLVECLSLAVAGGGLGVAFAIWARAGLLDWLGADLPSGALPLDARVLAFALVASLVTGAIFALAPVLASRRVTLTSALSESAATTASGRLARWPVVAQVAFSVVLLVAAALFVRTLETLLARDAGFATRTTLAAAIDSRAAGIPPAELASFNHRLLARLRQLPGVDAAALAYCGIVIGCRHTSGFVIAPTAGHGAMVADIQEDTVSPDFFRATGMRLLRGRVFEPSDGLESQPAVVVNQAFVRRYLAGGDPLGAALGYDAAHDTCCRIAGVIADAHVNGLDRPVPPMVYESNLQPGPPSRLYARFLAVRAAGDAEALIPALRRALAQVAPAMPVGAIRTLGQQAGRRLDDERVLARLALLFAALATLLAALALYGVLAHAVTRRQRELGLRMALGAARGEVFSLVLAGAARLAGLGLILGLGVALIAAQFLRSFLHGLSPADPTALAAGVGVLALAALLAALMPAYRAARLDPWRALREP